MAVPNSATPCSSDAQCAGMRCGTGLTPTCATNGRCRCTYATQNPPGTTPPARPPGAVDCASRQTSCQSTPACEAMCGAGWVCQSGICARSTGGGGASTPCTSSAQCVAMSCPTGQRGYCVGGTCQCSATAPAGEEVDPGGGSGGGGGGTTQQGVNPPERCNEVLRRLCESSSWQGGPGRWETFADGSCTCHPAGSGGGGGGGNGGGGGGGGQTNQQRWDAIQAGANAATCRQAIQTAQLGGTRLTAWLGGTADADIERVLQSAACTGTGGGGSGGTTQQGVNPPERCNEVLRRLCESSNWQGGPGRWETFADGSCTCHPREGGNGGAGTVDCNSVRTSCTDGGGECGNCAPVPGQTGEWRCQTEGVGKRCVWARGPGGICTSTTDCGSGQHCHTTAGRCVECLEDDHCEGDQTCNNGLCADPDGPDPAPCAGDQECVSRHGAGWTCVEGQCLGPGGGGGGLPTAAGVTPCTDNSNCPTGQICRNGRCQAETGDEPQWVPPAVGRAPTAPTLTGLNAPEVTAPGFTAPPEAPTAETLPTTPAPTAPTAGRVGAFTAAPAAPGALPGAVGTGEPLPTFAPPTKEDMEEDPGYKFRLREGLKAVAAGMNASGMLASGDAMRAFTKFSQEYASGEYAKVYARKEAEYERLTEKNKEQLRRKADDYNRKVQSVLTKHGMDMNQFRQVLAAQGVRRQDALANFGMSVREFEAKMTLRRDERQRVLQQFGMNVQQFNAALQAHGANRQRLLDEYGVSVDAWQRALAAHGVQRADVLAQFGMTQQSFNAMLNEVRTRLQLSEAQWGRWLSKFAIEQGNIRGLLGLA